MDRNGILQELIEQNNGYLLTSMVMEKGITKPYLAKYVKENDLEKVANTRLRDFYDVYEVMKMYADEVDKAVLRKAFRATCEKRKTLFSEEEMKQTLVQIEKNDGMKQMWEQFRKKNYFVADWVW